MWPFYLEEGVCLDEALHLDDSGASLLDVAGVHLERSRNWWPHLDDLASSRCGLLSGRGGLSR